MDVILAWLASITIQEVAAALVVLTTLMAFSKTVRKKIILLWKKLFPLREALTEHINEERETLNKILTELRPNGSASLRDAVDRIEHNLFDLEAFLSAQLNVHSVAVFRTDEKGKVIYVNRAYQRILGIAAHEAMGDGWINTVEPTHREKVLDLWREIVASRREASEDVPYVKLSTGEPLAGHVNIYKEVNRRGDLRGYLGVITFKDYHNGHVESCLEQLIELMENGYEIRPTKK